MPPRTGERRIENVIGWPSGSLAVGVNVYGVPTTIEVAGLPEIVGGRLVLLGGAMTLTSNAGRTVCALPSETHTTIPRCMPTSAAAGVPDSSPVAVLNDAQAGFASMPKISASPSASAAAGVNAYDDP